MQITDELASSSQVFPRVDTVEITNCDFVTDTGLRELAAAPRLRRVSDGSCVGVTGSWLASMPARVEARHDGSNANYGEGTRAETLIDYPDLPIPPGVAGPVGASPDDSGLLS